MTAIDASTDRERELATLREQRRRLFEQLLAATERERELIARDIHDDSIQVVIAARMRVEAIAERLGEGDRAALLEVRDELAGATDRLRSLEFDLGQEQLESEGLAAALRERLELAHSHDGLEYELVDHLPREPERATRALLYRFGQEAVGNAVKHADASRLSVLVGAGDRGFRLRVRDDGKGFSAKDALRSRPGHLGLPTLRSRLEAAGGALRVRTRPSAGSTIEATLPELNDASG